MSCNIIAKNHTVIKFWVNGQPQYIVERNAFPSNADARVAYVKRMSDCGNEWADVYNTVDSVVDVMTPGLESAINRLSY